MRAMSRRTWRTRAVFSSWPLARWKRRLKISLPSVSTSLGQLVVGCGRARRRLSCPSGAPPRRGGLTKRVAIGSFAARQARTPRARLGGTPSSSNMMRPGLTRQTQNSGEPLPLPMRTSAGFCDTGTSGKMRIQTRPTRRIWRVIARRAASIWRAVMRPGLDRLQAVGAEIERRAALGDAMDAALMRLAVFGAFRSEHVVYLFALAVAAAAALAPAGLGERACPAPSGRAPGSRP